MALTMVVALGRGPADPGPGDPASRARKASSKHWAKALLLQTDLRKDLICHHLEGPVMTRRLDPCEGNLPGNLALVGSSAPRTRSLCLLLVLVGLAHSHTHPHSGG